MDKSKKFKGRSISKGHAEGEAMVSSQFFGFTHGLEPKTGNITDERHEWRGQNVKGKVLVFPFGKSSSSGGLFVLEGIRNGNAPAAMVNVETEPVTGAGFVMGKIFYGVEIPVVDRLNCNPIEEIKPGDYVIVNGDEGTVEVRPKKGK